MVCHPIFINFRCDIVHFFVWQCSQSWDFRGPDCIGRAPPRSKSFPFVSPTVTGFSLTHQFCRRHCAGLCLSLHQNLHNMFQLQHIILKSRSHSISLGQFCTSRSSVTSLLDLGRFHLVTASHKHFGKPTDSMTRFKEVQMTRCGKPLDSGTHGLNAPCAPPCLV